MDAIETRRLCYACGQFHVFRDDLCWECIEILRRLAAEYETFGQDKPASSTNTTEEETR